MLCSAGSFPSTPHGHTSNASPQPSDQLQALPGDTSSPPRAASGQLDAADGYVELQTIAHDAQLLENGSKPELRGRGKSGGGGIRRSDTAYDSMDA